MKALEILKKQLKINYDNRPFFGAEIYHNEKIEVLHEAIQEIEDLQNENKSLVKTLEKMNEEMIDLRKENLDLKNSNNELLEGLISTQKRLEEWLEKCK